MEWVETTGRSLEEALDAALDELGVDEHDVEYEVLARPRGGLLGRFGGEARIRARVKPISREKPGEARRRPRRSRRGGGGVGEGDEKPAAAEGEPRERVGVGSRRAAAATDGGPRAGSRSRRRHRRRGRGGDSVNSTQEPGATVDEEPDMPVDEQIERAVDFTKGLVDTFGAKAEVSSRFEDEDTVLVDVTGDNLGLLVGPRGATLAAIEELVRTVVQRQTGGHGVRVHVDVAGYRAKRREALSEFARDLANRVREEGSERALEPMGAPDRKVVHDVVAEIDGVTTASEGEEPRRRVVIRPE
jgi:spoIIIJ-associated protein